VLQFSGGEGDNGEVVIDGVIIPRIEKFDIWVRLWKRNEILMKKLTTV